MTDDVMQAVVRLARHHSPEETCGFVVADKDSDLGARTVWMKNHHPNPTHNYAMDDDAVRQAYAEFDTTGEEPIAVFHSHPTTSPVLSADDIRGALDETLAYLVVSLEHPKASIRAYKIRKFVGDSLVSEVPISVQRTVTVPAPDAMAGPWALSIGNRVMITYRRTNKPPSNTVAVVTDLVDGAVLIAPERKTSPTMIPFERIQAVHILTQGAAGKRLAAELRSQAGVIRASLGMGEVAHLPDLVRTLAKAFPSGIDVSMEQQQ